LFALERLCKYQSVLILDIATVKWQSFPLPSKLTSIIDDFFICLLQQLFYPGLALHQAQVRGKSLTGLIIICDALIRPASTHKNPRGVFI
jgi:hypothetical protein